MPILTPERLKILCPEFAAIADEQLAPIILRAQGIVESALCCDRKLEKREHKINKKLDVGSQTCFIDFLPVDLNQAFIVKARFGSGYYHPTTGRSLIPSNFITVDPSGYFLNEFTGQLNLETFLTNPLFNAYGRSADFFQVGYTELNLQFTGGYDFSNPGDPIDPDIEEIQIYLAEIIKYMSKGFFTGEGLKMKRVDKWYEMQFIDNSSSVQVGSIPASLLAPLRKYGRNLHDY